MCRNNALPFFPLLASPFSVPTFPSGPFLPFWSFKHHSAFSFAISIPSVFQSCLNNHSHSSSNRTQLKTRKSLLKERIKHIYHLIATTRVVSDITDVLLSVQSYNLEQGHHTNVYWTEKKTSRPFSTNQLSY